MEPSFRGLDDYLGFWLRRLSDTVAARLEQDLAEYGVTVSQWDVLISIYRQDAVTAQDVAALMDINPSAVSRLVDRLEAKKLLARKADPRSRRRLLLVLTDEGTALIPRLSAAVDRHDKHFFGDLDDSQRAELKERLVGLLLRSREQNADDGR
ncbi:MarR family winged helix-turn-helix transcriptional regulator [Streptomyces formicae]|uniref:MarR family transcriptional regulator n=1 Tax=Streptomyces formicae TaxID=1616117 RepID=A0ABY3WP38_9ACTN|nr:MarR family transcriptional regulator [Streptomyces formicae]UNM12276.1 MarR family transcriptional regulator [Streptomyces formicae]